MSFFTERLGVQMKETITSQTLFFDSVLKKAMFGPFQKETTVKWMKQFQTSYLLTIPETSEYHVGKKYIDFLVETFEYLE